MRFVSRRVANSDTRADESIRLSKNNVYEDALEMGFNFKSVYSLMFIRAKTRLVLLSDVDGSLSNSKDLSHPNSSNIRNPLVAKSGLIKCKYTSQEENFSSPHPLVKARFNIKCPLKH